MTSTCTRSRGRPWRWWGRPGAGKSTLVNLLTRFYEYDTGEIFIDGQGLRELPKDAVRAAIGMVTQESFLFNGTHPREPAAWEAGRDRTRRCSRRWRRRTRGGFVDRMPKGLDTVVGERGVKLSVGEKQRVSIARALLKDPPILVLDEATASVDTATERLIQEALDRLMMERGRALSSRTGSRPCGTRARSWCWTTGGSWSAARMRSCWRWRDLRAAVREQFHGKPAPAGGGSLLIR